jgi:predicted nucleic-acid-binding protein
MKIAADTNVLLRDVLQDDPVHSRLAKKILQDAELVVIPVPVLCEFVWVLRQGYKRSASEIADAIRVLLDSSNVVVNQPAIEAGLAVLDKGGDFADGVIAYEGHWLGAEEFVSFDKQAVSLLKSQGKRARLLS